MIFIIYVFWKINIAVKQDYAINANFNIGTNGTNDKFKLNGYPYSAGEGINISEQNVISVNQSIIPQGIPAGCVMNYFGYTTPTGWHDCNGGELLKSEYPALYAAIGDTFGTASSSDKFKLPDLENRFIRHTTNTNQLFTTQDPGLPDISGSVQGIRFANLSATTAYGAMNAQHNNADPGIYGSGEGGRIGYIDFWASRSNPLYRTYYR